MTTKFFRCLLGGALIAGFLATPAMAGSVGTTTISFNDEVGIGLLTEQAYPTYLTAPTGSPNHGIISGAGYAYLVYDNERVTTTSPNEVSIVALHQPCGDTDPGATFCLFIADASNVNNAVLACFSQDDPGIGTLIRADGSSTNLGINFICGIQDFTLTYNVQSERATLMRQNNGVSVFLDVAFASSAPTSVVVGITSDGPAVIRKFIAFGLDIPEFPVVLDPPDAANPWVNFGLTVTGNGADTSPFKFLSEAVDLADGDPATIHIDSSTDSQETPTISGKHVLLVNEGGSPVSIGVPSRRDANLSTEGFVSRGSSVRRSVRRR